MGDLGQSLAPLQHRLSDLHPATEYTLTIYSQYKHGSVRSDASTVTFTTDEDIPSAKTPVRVTRLVVTSQFVIDTRIMCSTSATDTVWGSGEVLEAYKLMTHTHLLSDIFMTRAQLLIRVGTCTCTYRYMYMYMYINLVISRRCEERISGGHRLITLIVTSRLLGRYGTSIITTIHCTFVTLCFCFLETRT